MNPASKLKITTLDRRRFLCGTGWALALPLFESLSLSKV